jgi:CDGSH-type Zn-finger protein
MIMKKERYFKLEGGFMSEDKKEKILIVKNGPYLVSGRVPLDKKIIETDNKGKSATWGKGDSYPVQEAYALCRCGQSSNNPYCDGSHIKTGFDGTEAASRKKYIEQAKIFEGPGVDLNDAKRLCAGARYCDRGTGTWKLTKRSNKPDAKEMAIQEACDCPSGRLVALDKETAKLIEPHLEPSISLIEDPHKKVSVPIQAKGGLSLESSDGFEYEKRNRVALCRCGKSKNKPFCDATHISVKFNDGDKSLSK